MSELVPCPGCGNKPEENYYDGLIWYRCECGWTQGGEAHSAKEAAILWDHRVYPPEVQEVFSAVKRYTHENVIKNNNAYMWEALQILYALETDKIA